jgi:hypothetical protein
MVGTSFGKKNFSRFGGLRPTNHDVIGGAIKGRLFWLDILPM